jgi:hypothetical protein
MDRENVGMLEPGRELDLALEALGAECGGQLGMEHLQGYRPVVPKVVGEVYRGHAAASKLALDAVAVGEARSELIVKVYCQGNTLMGNA